MENNSFSKMLEEAKSKPEWNLEKFRIEFAEVIWKWMEENKFQTTKLLAAEKLGISQQKLTMILKGNCDLKLSETFKILFIIGKDIKIV